MSDTRVIGVGALLHSAAFGLIAIAATSRGGGLLLVDVRLSVCADGGRAVIATLRHDSGVPLAVLCIEAVLLDDHGHPLASVRSLSAALSAGACCRVSSPPLLPTASRFRFQRVGVPA